MQLWIEWWRVEPPPGTSSALSLAPFLPPSLALEVQLCPTRGEEEDGCSRRVKTCTRTSGRLTQSEKCCMATVHKGTRFLRMYVSSVLVCGVFMCVCVSHRRNFIAKLGGFYTHSSQQRHDRTPHSCHRYLNNSNGGAGGKYI